MCDETLRMEPRSSEFVPNYLKMQRMRNEEVHREPYTLGYAPDHLIYRKYVTR